MEVGFKILESGLCFQTGKTSTFLPWKTRLLLLAIQCCLSTAFLVFFASTTLG
jgi:hypothetical protein